jgi:AsmA protein
MKKIAASLIVVATVVVGLLFVLPTLISTDWARSELGRQLSSASGMDIRLEGPVRLSFLPGLAVVAKDVSVATGEGDVSIEVPGFSTAITVSSLWSDKFEIQSIALVDPAITITSTASKAEAQPASSDKTKIDPFASLVDTLERLAVNRVTVENGSLTIVDGAGNSSTISAIDVDLKAPDLDQEVAFSLAATQDGRRVELDGTLSALRPILQRQPAKISLEAAIEPAPSPLVAAIKASGEIRLNANGSYQIRGGKFDLGGQAFQLDVLFQPGERSRFLADLTAKRVDIGVLAGAGEVGESETPASTSSSAEPNLLMLSNIDADISVTIEQLVSGALTASNVQLSGALHDGQLEAKLEHLGLDAGSIAASVSNVVRNAVPTLQGKIVSSGLDIGAMAKLLGQAVPMTGKVTVNTAFAFRGLTAERLRESLNLSGTVGIRQGKVSMAALVGNEARRGDITGLNADMKIKDIGKPVDLVGKLTWQGQEVAFQSQLAPADFLSSSSIAEASGPVSLSVASNYLRASVNGTVSGAGTFKGQVSAASSSVDRLLKWLGQNGASGLQAFDFKGTVDASPQGVTFSKTNVALNGVKASGEGSVKLGTPLNIRTSLNFAKLDFAALAGEGEGTAGAKQKSAGPGDAPLDLSFLKGLDAKIDVAADKIGYGKVFAGPVKTTLVIRDGVADLTVSQCPFYGGTVTAEMSADGSGEVPALKLNMAIAGVAAAPLLDDAAGFDRLEGKLNTTIAISGAGKTTMALRRSLEGNASVKFSDGALRGIDIAEVYNNLVGLLASGFRQDESKKTTFTELGASFAIRKGIAETNDISLLGPLVRMDGTGTIDLTGQTLDIHLNPRVVASLSGQGGNVEAKGIGVPVIVDGSLSAPRIYPDLRKLMKDPKGALEMLSRLGLPTEKLNLDKLLPGQAGSGGGKGAADLIGDLIKGGGNAAGNSTGSGLADIIGGALSGQAQSTGQQDEGQPGAGQPRDAGSAAKAIIGDLIKGKAAKPEPSPGVTPNAGTEAAQQGQAGASMQPAANPAVPQEPAVPDASPKGEIGSLLDQLLR